MIQFFLESFILLSLISYCFYSSILPLISLPIVLKWYFRYRKKSCINKRIQQLSLQFKDLLISLQALLQAGYSFENAMREAYLDLGKLYRKNSDILVEVRYIINGIHMNHPIEEMIENFGQRSGIEEIREFSEVFSIAKRGGGNLPLIIQDSCQIITDRLDVKDEIQVIISAKVFESRIMMCVPLFMIAYIRFSSPGYLEILYGSAIGAILMSVCLLFYLLSIYLFNKITDIKI